MMNMQKIRRIIAKLLLGVAYFSLVIQYFWVLIVLLPTMIDSGVFDYATASPSNPAPVIEAPTIEASPMVLLIVSAITVGLILVTIIALMRIPKAVVETSEHVVHRAADAVIPTITHHKKLSKKRQRLLTDRLSLSLQLGATVLPFIASFFLPETGPITTQIVLIVSALFAGISLLGFVSAWLVRPAPTTSRTRSHASRG